MNVNTPRVQVPVNVNIPSPALAHQASSGMGGWQQGKVEQAWELGMAEGQPGKGPEAVMQGLSRGRSQSSSTPTSEASPHAGMLSMNLYSASAEESVRPWEGQCPFCPFGCIYMAYRHDRRGC